MSARQFPVPRIAARARRRRCRARIRGTDARSARDDSAAAQRTRSARPGRHGHRKDRRVRAADAAADWRGAPGSAPDLRPGAGPHPRAGDAGGRGGAQVRQGRRADACCRSTAARRCTSRSAPSNAAPTSSSPRRAARWITCKRDDAARSTALQVLVLDEADEMLDMGFADDLDAILKATPGTRQTALFSATMPARILSIAGRHLKNPARVTIEREKTGDRQGAAGPAGRLHRQSRAQAGDARPHPRHGGSGRDARVLPHPDGSRRAGRNLQRARPPQRGAARRHDAAPARPRHGISSARRRPTC